MLQAEVTSERSAVLPHRRADATGAVLSRRQQEVLELLASGIPAREIAALLGLAETTVRNHIRHLLQKLDCHSQLEAVAVAYRLNLLLPPGWAPHLPGSAAAPGTAPEGTGSPGRSRR